MKIPFKPMPKVIWTIPTPEVIMNDQIVESSKYKIGEKVFYHEGRPNYCTTL
jgi:hypothetical protein